MVQPTGQSSYLIPWWQREVDGERCSETKERRLLTLLKLASGVMMLSVPVATSCLYQGCEKAGTAEKTSSLLKFNFCSGDAGPLPRHISLNLYFISKNI